MTYPFTGTIEGEITGDLQGPQGEPGVDGAPGADGAEGPPGPPGEPGAGVDAPDVGIRYVTVDGDDTNDGLSWGTAYRTIAHAATIAPKLEIRIGAGEFVEGNINWAYAQSFIGLGPVSTLIRQLPSSNQSVFRTAPTYPTTDFLHNSAIRNMQIIGDRATNTAGHGIVFNQRVGENTLIENIIIGSFPEDNIRTNYGGQPIFWRDVHTFMSGGYGIGFRRSGGDRFQGVTVYGLSGDNNKLGLAHIYNAGSRNQEAFTFVGVKAETTLAGNQADVIVIEASQCPITIMGGATLKSGPGTGNSVVKILPSTSGITNVHVNIIGFTTDYTNWVDDRKNNVTIPTTEPGQEAMFLSYREGKALIHISGQRGKAPFFGTGLSIPEVMPVPLTWPGLATLFVDVDGDLAVKFGDGVIVKAAVHP